MRYAHLLTADLNLLNHLQLLLEERHISRAAARGSLSQPAMSRVLDRLRIMFGDELLIRGSGGYLRTARGEHLLRELETLLPQLEALVRGERFDPGQSKMRFRAAMTDFFCTMLLPGLIHRLHTAAPGITLEVPAWTDDRFRELDSGKLDLVLDAGDPPAHLSYAKLFTDSFVCIVAVDHPFRKKRFTLRDYLKQSHVLLNVLAGQQTLVDVPLMQLGFTRTVTLQVPYFVAATLTASQTDLVLTVPSRLMGRLPVSDGMRIVEAPKELPGFDYGMSWHPRQTGDPAHTWFRELIQKTVTAMSDRARGPQSHL